jgi:hypothetical protein
MYLFCQFSESVKVEGELIILSRHQCHVAFWLPSRRFCLLRGTSAQTGSRRDERPRHACARRQRIWEWISESRPDLGHVPLR